MNIATSMHTPQHPMSDDSRVSMDGTAPPVESAGVTDQDIICGRSSATKTHPGNKAFRELVNKNKPLYASCVRSEKHKVSLSIVHAIQKVGGRFLQLDAKSDEWHDIGDKKALEKVSQALREGQPELRQKLTTNTPTISDETSSSDSFASPSRDFRREDTAINSSLSNGLSAKVGTETGATPPVGPCVFLNSLPQDISASASGPQAVALDFYYQHSTPTTSSDITSSYGASTQLNAHHLAYEPVPADAPYCNDYNPRSEDWDAIAEDLSDFNASYAVRTITEHECKENSGQHREEDTLNEEPADFHPPRRRASFPGLMASTSVQHDLYASVCPPLPSSTHNPPNFGFDRSELMEKGLSAMSLMSEMSDGLLSMDDFLIGLRVDEMSSVDMDPFRMRTLSESSVTTSRRRSSLFNRHPSIKRLPLDIDGEFTMESARSLMTAIGKIGTSGRSLMSMSDL